MNNNINNDNNINNNINDNNNVTIQFTMFSNKGYKPISTLLKFSSLEYYKENKKEMNERAIKKICAKRYMTKWELIKYGYTSLKVRIAEEKKD